jgi:small subunit ribosomal protein S13
VVARIAGVDLPSGKRVEIGLTYIYGIGRTRAIGILGKADVAEGIKVNV